MFGSQGAGRALPEVIVHPFVLAWQVLNAASTTWLRCRPCGCRPNRQRNRASWGLSTTGWIAVAGLAQIVAAALTLCTLIFFGIQIMGSLRATRPRLEPRVSGNPYVWPRRGRVHYVNGSSPAFDVEVWVQSANEPNEYLISPCSTLTPSRERTPTRLTRSTRPRRMR
jgi:hypothetical protein